MAFYTYAQTDTADTFDVGCSGQTAGVTTAARKLLEGGTAGTVAINGDPGNNVTRAVFSWDSTTPVGKATWEAGNWTIPINISTCDGGTQLTRVDVCDENGATYTTVASNTSPGHTRGATGVLTVTVVQGSAHTAQSAANSAVHIVLTFNNNDLHGNSTSQITCNQIITTPIVIPVITTTTTSTTSSTTTTSTTTTTTIAPRTRSWAGAVSYSPGGQY